MVSFVSTLRETSSTFRLTRGVIDRVRCPWAIAGMTKSLRLILRLFAATENDHKCWERAQSGAITESDLQATRQKWHAPFERLVRRPQAGPKVRPLRIPMPVPQIFTEISQDLTVQYTCFLNMFCHKLVTLNKISKTRFYF